MKMRSQNVAVAPKPVRPTTIRTHGLFGIPFVRQHMVVDERWTPNSLTEQFKGMADLLSRRQNFKVLDTKANRKRLIRENRNLRLQCRDGRSKLQKSLYGESTRKIRNFLINHKDMQRLYQKMPVHLVVDNINQKTFVMRKERDRLRFRLDQLKLVYRKKLLERALLESRIKYENVFVLEEDVKLREFHKKIENSNVRLKAIKTINGTYKKMIQILRHDCIFYEPILRSLSKDTEDQGNFIKHILYLGMPAIAKFKELSEEYRQMEDKSRKNLHSKLQFMSNYKKVESRRQSMAVNRPTNQRPDDANVPKLRRFVRETHSMNMLKQQLESIESTIKQVKFATSSSQAKEIYPRIKSQVDNNVRLHKMIENGTLGHQCLVTKMQRAEVLEGVLINNNSEEEIKRLERIKDLQESIEKENQFEAKTIAHMKNRADAYVLLRLTLWNLNEILRHVDRPSKVSRIHYPNSYLKLPLLKFDMFTMRACAPEIYEENVDAIMHLVMRKVHKLMKAYKVELPKETTALHVNEYHTTFLESIEVGDDLTEGGDVQQQAVEEDMLAEQRTLLNVPNRKQIKAQSAKLVEELSKKED